MSNLTILIFENKIFFEILKELKLFPKFKIKYSENIDLSLKELQKDDQISVFFKNSLIQVKSNSLQEQLKLPFKILDFEKKITSLLAKNEFKKNSLIRLGPYVINKNERKIKRNDLELQLSEKEINFLILFSEKNEPISKNLVLQKVWNYSQETETHTVETHIHRLRKKILDKFSDNNFIKNDKKGYYI